jgi:hypothetical protein
VLAAVLLSGIFILHLSAPGEWRGVAMEKFSDVQGPSWRGGQLERIWDERAQHVKDAFVGAYGHYQKYAFGADEVFPLSNQSRNKYANYPVFALITKTLPLVSTDGVYQLLILLTQ